MNSLCDRLIVVTGAASGIGRATALRFGREGAHLVVADVDAEGAGRTAASARRAGVRADAFAVDVGDHRAMERFAAAVRASHGVPDVIVNNAGIGFAGPILSTGADDWDRLLAINLLGVVDGSRLFAAQMVEEHRRGHIVNVASAAAFAPSRALPAYATSKAAVLMFTECLRVELRPHGIGVTAICPGVINTGIVRTGRIVGGDDPEGARARAIRLYARRNYTPERVAGHIVRAVHRNRAVVPVAIEAHALRAFARLTPSGARLLARAGLGI